MRAFVCFAALVVVAMATAAPFFPATYEYSNCDTTTQFAPLCSATATPCGEYFNGGLIQSDVDGVSNNTKLRAREQCSWTLTCPTDSYVWINNVSGNVGTGNFGPNWVSSFLRASGELDYDYRGFNTERQSATFDLNLAVGGSSSSFSSYDGFDMYWECIPRTCSANVTRAGSFSGGGYIKTDLDGYLNGTQHGRAQECRWFLSCPSGSMLWIDNITGWLGHNSTIKISSGVRGIFVSESINNLTASGINDRHFADTNTAVIDFDSGILFEDAGFDLGWSCQTITCGAVGDPPGREENGTITDTDRDGAGATSNYTALDDCRWTLACPVEGEILWINSLTGILEDGDNVTLTNAITGEVIMQKSGNLTAQEIAHINTRASTVTYRFVAAPKSPGHNGASLDWKCYLPTCRATVTPNGTYNESRSLVIHSDTDGAGATNYANREECIWELECPVGHYLWIDNVTGWVNETLYIENSIGVQVLSLTGNLTANMASTDKFMSTQNGIIKFDSNGGTEATADGFSVYYSCRLPQCTALTPVGERKASPETIQTDKDGAGGNETTFYENCKWDLVCDNNAYVWITRVQESLGNNETVLALVSNFTNVTLANNTFTQAYVSENTTLSVFFNATDNVTVGNGFELDWQCYTCSATGTGRLTGSGGSIKSDTDGADAAVKYQPGERCSWNIRCNADEVVWFTAATGDLFNTDKVVITYNGDLTRTLISNITAANSVDYWKTLSPNADVQFFSYDPKNTSNGFTLDWKCYKPACSAAAGPDGTRVAASGDIVSDSDGEGTREYERGELCVYQLTCPAGQYVRTNNITGYITGLDTVRIFDPSVNEYVYSYNGANGNFSLLGVNHYYSQSQNMTVTFTSTTGPATGSPEGFRLNWGCFSPQCSRLGTNVGNQSRPAEEFAELRSDLDGSNYTSEYGFQEYCEWNLNCYDDEYVWLDNATWSLATDDTVFINQVDNLLNISNFTGAGSLTESWVWQSQIQVRLDANNTVETGNGFEAKWSCNKKCSSNTTATESILYGGGVIMSDTDGAGTDAKYLDRERCRWYLRCPANQFVQIDAAAGAIAVGDYLEFVVNNNTARRVTGSVACGFKNTGVLPYSLRSSSADLYFYTNNDGVVGHGFNLSWSCITPSCNINATRPGAVFSGTTVKSDADGDESTYRTPKDDYCAWNLQCAPTEVVYLNRSSGYLGVCENVLTVVAGDDRDTYSGNINGDILGELTWQQTVDVTLAMGGRSSGWGMELAWECWGLVRVNLTFDCVDVNVALITKNTVETDMIQSLGLQLNLPTTEFKIRSSETVLTRSKISVLVAIRNPPVGYADIVSSFSAANLGNVSALLSINASDINIGSVVVPGASSAAGMSVFFAAAVAALLALLF